MLHGIQQGANYFPYNGLPKLVPIAPADNKCAIESEKKRYTMKGNPYTGAQAASIARRNARERNRVKQVNDGFNALRKKLPAAVITALSGGSRRGSGKKLSKVDTLKMVVEYIRYMERLLDSDAGVTKCSPVDTSAYEVDEGICGGRNSPYSDCIPSPTGSECSSGVSSAYSSCNGYVLNNYHYSEGQTPMEDSELLDAISWWQEK